MNRLLALFMAPIALVLAVAGVDRGIDHLPALEPEPQLTAAAPPPTPEWAAPAWLRGSDAAAIDAMAERGPQRGPRVNSVSALVFDVDAGRVLFEQAADEAWPVASLTKVVSAVALGSTQADLEGRVCIGAEHYPTRSGARSKLNTGDCASGWDMLGAAMVASDNRAAYALATVSGLGVDAFVDRMNAVSAELGMADSEWVEPSGIQDDNRSTARDIARATLALANLPELAPATAAPFWDLHRATRPTRRLFTTNKLVGRDDLDFIVVKTGYTDTARYCLSAMVETPSGQRLVVTLLRASGRQTRWADMRRILDWVEDQPIAG